MATIRNHFLSLHSNLFCDYLSDDDYRKLMKNISIKIQYTYIPCGISVYRITSKTYQQRLNTMPIKNISNCTILIQTINGKAYQNINNMSYDRLIFINYYGTFFWVPMKEISLDEYSEI